MINIMNEICKTLKITYDELIKLTAKDIEELAAKRQEEEILKRIEEGQKQIKLLRYIIKDWDVLVSYFGEDVLIRTFAKHRSFEDYFSTSAYGHIPDTIQHLSKEEIELFRTAPGASRYYTLYNYYVEQVMAEIPSLWNKNLSCYSIAIHRYYGINSKVTITFEMENKSKYYLETTLYSILNGDVDSIINDSLDEKNFHRCTNKESDLYKSINAFFISKEWNEFAKIIQEKS